MAPRCLRVGAVHSIKRVGFPMSDVCPVYPRHRTFPEPVGSSHLGHKHARAQRAEVLDVGIASGPPKWIKPQLTRLVDGAPAGNDWLHEIKYDGYRMHARLDGGRIQLLTRTGLDWSHR